MRVMSAVDAMRAHSCASDATTALAPTRKTHYDSSCMAHRTYSEAEVQEILRVAIERHSQQASLNRQDIEDIATDMGLEAPAIRRAIEQFDRTHELEAELVVLRRRRHHSLWSTSATWLIVNGGMWGLCAVTQSGFWNACYWTAGVSGTLLLLKAQWTLFRNPDKDRRRAEKRLAARHSADHQREKKRSRAKPPQRQRSASSRSGQGSPSMTQLEALIERGVTELLEAAAKKMGLNPKEPPAPNSEKKKDPADRG